MLDHVFTDAIGSLREVFEDALLERQAFEERFHADVLLGDVVWETSYGLPGEGLPPRVQVDLTLEWPTWSQSAYRNWYLHGEFDESPTIVIEIVVRVQRLADPPDPAVVMDALPASGPPIGEEPLERSAPTVETAWDDDLTEAEYAIEVTYAGEYAFGEDTLADGSVIDVYFASLGGWVSSTLVRLGDLPLHFRPPSDD